MQLHGYQIDGEQADKGVVTILDPDGNDARWNAEALRETIRQHRRIEEPRESTVQWIAVLWKRRSTSWKGKHDANEKSDTIPRHYHEHMGPAVL